MSVAQKTNKKRRTGTGTGTGPGTEKEKEKPLVPVSVPDGVFSDDDEVGVHWQDAAQEQKQLDRVEFARGEHRENNKTVRRWVTGTGHVTSVNVFAGTFPFFTRFTMRLVHRGGREGRGPPDGDEFVFFGTLPTFSPLVTYTIAMAHRGRGPVRAFSVVSASPMGEISPRALRECAWTDAGDKETWARAVQRGLDLVRGFGAGADADGSQSKSKSRSVSGVLSEDGLVRFGAQMAGSKLFVRVFERSMFPRAYFAAWACDYWAPEELRRLPLAVFDTVSAWNGDVEMGAQTLFSLCHQAWGPGNTKSARALFSLFKPTTPFHVFVRIVGGSGSGSGSGGINGNEKKYLFARHVFWKSMYVTGGHVAQPVRELDFAFCAGLGWAVPLAGGCEMEIGPEKEKEKEKGERAWPKDVLASFRARVSEIVDPRSVCRARVRGEMTSTWLCKWLEEPSVRESACVCMDVSNNCMLALLGVLFFLFESENVAFDVRVPACIEAEAVRAVFAGTGVDVQRLKSRRGMLGTADICVYVFCERMHGAHEFACPHVGVSKRIFIGDSFFGECGLFAALCGTRGDVGLVPVAGFDYSESACASTRELAMAARACISWTGLGMDGKRLETYLRPASGFLPSDETALAAKDTLFLVASVSEWQKHNAPRMNARGMVCTGARLVDARAGAVMHVVETRAMSARGELQPERAYLRSGMPHDVFRTEPPRVHRTCCGTGGGGPGGGGGEEFGKWGVHVHELGVVLVDHVRMPRVQSASAVHVLLDASTMAREDLYACFQLATSEVVLFGHGGALAEILARRVPRDLYAHLRVSQTILE